ncbi:MAG: serine/threonine protein kinase [Planctomycetes bacterium]|nr:serine/threonine protein kinase [Planctomycetota bacterium]
MGVVYLARDTKLDRDVALKVLPETLAGDTERIARFRREAKVLASLNHPNIGAIYGFEESDGKCCLVLEYVEGETLAARLKRGPLPTDEALDVARQLAEAFEAAHEKGVIHRDLKPGNVMLRPDGTVKVLDFGLAKAMADGSDMSEADRANSPTITANFTRPGVVLGTAAYMSPEQARGKPLDKRTDIWSFGVVLFESLTGKRPFEGDTVSDLVARILEREPDWSELPSETPPTIQLLLRRCLAKDRKQRLHDISDARIELEEAIADPTSASLGLASRAEGAATPTQALHRVSWTAAVSGAVAFLLVGIGATWLLTRPKPPAPALPMRFDIGLPEGTNFPSGVGKNIAPLQKKKMIPYEVLTACQLKKYLNADW